MSKKLYLGNIIMRLKSIFKETFSGWEKEPHQVSHNEKFCQSRGFQYLKEVF